jgi:hypothetical protein
MTFNLLDYKTLFFENEESQGRRGVWLLRSLQRKISGRDERNTTREGI